MKSRILLLTALCCLVGTTAAQTAALRAVQDSVWRWRRAHADDPLAQNILWSCQLDRVVEVQLLRADSVARSDFRLRVHDSPSIRLCGFDPDTASYPPAPEGEAPPGELSLETQYAFYPTGTDTLRLTLRSRSCEPVFFGEDYTVCRFQHGRWEALPIPSWKSVLYGLGPDPFSPSAGPRLPAPAGGYTHTFTAWLAAAVFPTEYGRYRICKQVFREHPRRDYLLTTEFTVTPFVPFTRFTR